MNDHIARAVLGALWPLSPAEACGGTSRIRDMVSVEGRGGDLREALNSAEASGGTSRIWEMLSAEWRGRKGCMPLLIRYLVPSYLILWTFYHPRPPLSS